MRERLSIWGRSPDRRQDAGVNDQETNMAKAATADSVGESRRGPNYKAAISVMRTEIPAQKTRVGKINEQIGDLYGKIEGSHKVHKLAAKFFMKLDDIEDQTERQDVFRSLMGLVMNSGWPIMVGDLVDRAENAEVDPRVWWNRDHPEKQVDVGGQEPAGDQSADDDVKDQAEKAAEKPARVTKPKGITAAKEAATRHLRAVPDPTPNADPDADLAGDD